MPNLVNYTNKTSVIENRLKNLDSHAADMYNSGEYTSEEIEYYLKTSIVEILNTIGQSSMKVRPALTVPVFEDYQRMTEEAVNDLDASIMDAVSLYRTNQESAGENETFKTMISGRINFLKKNVEALERTLSAETLGKGYSSFHETFGSTINTSAGSASVNMLSGALTLGVKKQGQKNSYLAEVLDGSTGYPGNTHEALRRNGEIVFEGESDLHADVNSIIDGNDDSWFEYEIIELKEEAVDQTGGLGLEYDEGLSWVTDDKKVTLRLRLTLREQSDCNVFTLRPFLAKVKGSTPALVSSVTVYSEDMTQVQKILGGSVFDSVLFTIFNAQPVKFIDMVLEQTVPYGTEIGHFYYGRINEETGIVSRTEGPLPKVSVLGLTYSPKDKAFLQPKGYDEDGESRFFDENRAKDELFGFSLKEENCHKEILPAGRYLIGIRDAEASYQEFEEKSTYISRIFKTNEKISSVSLESDELFPESFGLKESWIRYYISFDQGKEWLPILPRYRSHTGASTYKINSLDLSKGAEGNVKHIYRLYDSRELMLKIELSRPAELKSSTPVVYSYNLNVRTGDEILD